MAIFYSICVALGDPKHNSYLWCLGLLLKTLLKTGTYHPGRDQYYVLADPDTIELAKKMPFYQHFDFLAVPKPADVYSIMLLKYRFPQLFPRLRELNQTIVYLDTDLLNTRHVSFDIPPDSLIVFPEGAPTDTNYCGKPEKLLTLPFGATAGFFVFKWGPRVEAFFESVLRDLTLSQERWYCLDQPAFNIYLPVALSGAMDPALVSFNGNNYDMAKTAFINCCGDPGDGHFHLSKMFSFAMSLL